MIVMNYKVRHSDYLTPEARVYGMVPEGVLCMSQGEAGTDDLKTDESWMEIFGWK